MKRLVLNLFSLFFVVALLLPESFFVASAGTDPAPAAAVELGMAPQPEWMRYDPNAKPVNVPPPAQYFQPHPQAATFNITYIPNGGIDPFGDTCLTFPEEAKAAFNNAANYWASLLTSTVPIRIQACWAPLGEGILGGSSSINSFANFSNAAVLNTWYPVALANALQGSDLDPARDDMAIVYSSNFGRFYYGTGPVPFDKTDFTTVVMHEIGHGLGFSGSMDICYGMGVWAYNWNCSPMNPPYPDSYDRFAVDGAGHGLIDPAYYTNNSAALAAALKSNNLYFNGENARFANGGANVRLFAPYSWQQGSSYSHLDYLTFGGTSNALMVFAIGDGYAIHDPGPVGMGLLKDVGWAPFAPGDLTATLQANGKVNLSWTGHSRNQVGYKVERSPDGSTSWAQIGTSTSAAYTDNNPPSGSSFYRVRAYHAAGDSLYSNVAAIPLASPANLTATASTPSKVDLAWMDPNNNETNYQISRSTGEDGIFQPLVDLPANTTIYSDATVHPGTAYQYEVRAINTGGIPAPSSWSFASAVTPLNPPLGLAAIAAVFPGQVTLSWQDSNDNETGYTVESSITGAAPWTALCITPADGTGCSMSGLQEVATYHFQVRASNAVAQSAAAATSAVTTLLPPDALAAAVLPGNGVSLRWVNHSLLASGYELQRSTNGVTWDTSFPQLPASATSYNDLDVTSGKVYYYRVRAVGAAPGSESPFTPELKAVTGPYWIYLSAILR